MAGLPKIPVAFDRCHNGAHIECVDTASPKDSRNDADAFFLWLYQSASSSFFDQLQMRFSEYRAMSAEMHGEYTRMIAKDLGL